MNNIPTAEEYLNTIGVPVEHLQNLPWFDYGNLLTWLEEYSNQKSKLHVEAALKAAAENTKIKVTYYSEEENSSKKLREIADTANLSSLRTDGDGDLYGVDTYEVDEESILNAYPLTNIK